MSHLNSSSVAAECPLSFLKRNPILSNSLFVDCDHNLDEVSTIIAPILKAQDRCQLTTHYIQAVTTGRTAFLATNLAEPSTTFVTEIASSWLIGRSQVCAIAVENDAVSRRHAVICHYPHDGFYITDAGSKNGTRINQRRLDPLERRLLRDGDLIQLGNLKVEFFATVRNQPIQAPQLSASEATFY